MNEYYREHLLAELATPLSPTGAIYFYTALTEAMKNSSLQYTFSQDDFHSIDLNSKQALALFEIQIRISIENQYIRMPVWAEVQIENQWPSTVFLNSRLPSLQIEESMSLLNIQYFKSVCGLKQKSILVFIALHKNSTNGVGTLTLEQLHAILNIDAQSSYSNTSILKSRILLPALAELSQRGLVDLETYMDLDIALRPRQAPYPIAAFSITLGNGIENSLPSKHAVQDITLSDITPPPPVTLPNDEKKIPSKPPSDKQLKFLASLLKLPNDESTFEQLKVQFPSSSLISQEINRLHEPRKGA